MGCASSRTETRTATQRTAALYAIEWAEAGATSVDLRLARIGDAGATQLAGMLRENETVTRMYLGDNQIGDEGARALADGLRENETVTRMDLGSNPMSAAAKQAVRDLVAQNKVLAAIARESVDLCGVGIGDAGATKLAGMLRENETVTTMNLRFNQIGDEGARALADGLRENETVTTMRLSNNRIGNEGARWRMGCGRTRR